MVLRSSTARRVDGVDGEREETPVNAPLEEAVLDVLLRRDGVAAGDRREACGRMGAVFARRAARGRAAARAQRSGHPWRRRAGEIRGGRCHLELAPFPASGGIESCGYAPDAAAKLPTTIAERIRMVAEVYGAKL